MTKHKNSKYMGRKLVVNSKSKAKTHNIFLCHSRTMKALFSSCPEAPLPLHAWHKQISKEDISVSILVRGCARRAADIQMVYVSETAYLSNLKPAHPTAGRSEARHCEARRGWAAGRSRPAGRYGAGRGRRKRSGFLRLGYELWY